MFIKCNMCDGCDFVLIHLTVNDRYEIRYHYEEGLFLILPDKEIQLRDMDCYCSGRPKLREYTVGDLYTDMLGKHHQQNSSDGKLRRNYRH